jgi:SAM-dependent methyltransferase
MYRKAKNINMLDFTNYKLFDILNIIQKEIKQLKIHSILEFKISNPNYKDLVDMAQIFYCEMLNPIIIDTNNIIVRYKKLNQNSSFHKDIDDTEKYGINSNFATINKNNHTSFLYYYLQSLKLIELNSRIRILNLGINSGEEFEIIKKYSNNFKNQELIGIDYCQSAIQKAKENFKDENINFIQADIKDIDKLNLGKFDLVISIGTLQSTNLNFNILFQDIVQKYLKKNGAIILGFPNCRWIDSQMVYGAKMKNYNFPESSLVFKDVIFCKKYLQQKRFKVNIIGKDYIFLIATSNKI